MSAREHVAWLLWCANQGYLKKEDRDILGMQAGSFVKEMSLHVDDRAELPHWLDMADRVLDAIKRETS